MQRKNQGQDSWREGSSSKRNRLDDSRQGDIAKNERPRNDQRRDSNNSGGYKRKNDSNQENKNEHKKPRLEMGFKCIENLLKNEDLEEIVFTLSNDRRGFRELLENTNSSNDMIVLIVKLLSKVCNCNFISAKSNILQIVLNSKFVDSLVNYVLRLPVQELKDKKRNNFFWQDPDAFFYSLLNMTRNITDLLPLSSCEHIFKIVRSTKLIMPLIENEHSINVSNEIKSRTVSLYDIMEKKKNDFETNRTLKRKGVNELEPPDDFRNISIYPSSFEVTNPKSPFLRRNVVEGPYNSVHHYLDVQFRLLREDFVAPLRKGICRYMKDPKQKLDDIKIYKYVQFLNVETVNEQNCYRIQYDFSKRKKTFNYENSKRFMYGSLICFTADNFVTIIFGKIVQRDVVDLEKGQLIVGFDEDVTLPENICEQKYIMVESAVYFEPYYHVLKVLKTMQSDNFPMEKYIIKVETDTRPPAYLLGIHPVFYEIENEKFFPLDWGDRKFYGLNESQHLAFKSALTQQFTLIQGPPGTGKTFLGLKIASTLLNNTLAWYNRTPILVICYTNHALDQFLEGLLPVTHSIIRVGSQSKNENLNQFNIRNLRNNYNPTVNQKRNEVRLYIKEITTINKNLSQIEQYDSVIDFSLFEEVIPEYRYSWFSRVTEDKIKRWLLGGRHLENREFQKNRKEDHNLTQAINDVKNLDAKNEDDEVEEETFETTDENMIDEVFDDIVVYSFTPLISLKNLRDEIERLQIAKNETRKLPLLQALIQEEEITNKLRKVEGDFRYLQMKLSDIKERKYKEKLDLADLQYPFNIPQRARWHLYSNWLDMYTAKLLQKKERLSKKFRDVYRTYSEMREIKDTQVMKNALIVGLTTTCASRLQSTLQTLKSPIVIVEEAAEVLEAHIVSSLTKHCKHLILIGDHKQLRPGTADFRIETKYLLGVSLFERMVSNKVQCYTLDTQHRMRPEISCLVCPSIYPVLENHETVFNRLPILGLEKCVYFVDHQEPEQACSDSSKKNVHESKFLIRLAIYLILNGYNPENITILAAYLGQMFEMQREKKRHNLLLKNVRIAVLDNYQGEENDIILLSLVRNNADNKIGFLKTENRVCVALSRARCGFYIMGNMSLLCDNSEIWPKVKEVLERQNAVGPYLALTCQVHTHKTTQVKSADDFMENPEGGCNLLCEALLTCNHVCKSLCHIVDREHKTKYKCIEKCNRKLCDDLTHLCKKLCHEDCGLCLYPVERNLDCGHSATLDCHIDPTTYKCMELVTTKLPCGHEMEKRCHENPEDVKCTFPCRIQVEPCGHACIRTCHINSDPDHLQYKCRKPCVKIRKGCSVEGENKHTCPNKCFEECAECDIEVDKCRICSHRHTVACKENVNEITCEQPCTKTLPCGHKCKLKCNKPCGSCNAPVFKVIPDCNHEVRLKCSEEPHRKFCKSKCPRILPCGHQCVKKCFEDCNTSICKVSVDCSFPSPCGHVVTKISCHLKNSDSIDPKILLRNCTEKCNSKLKCEHICSGTCGKCSQGRVHVRCREKCGVPLICNHECPIPCRQACKPCEKQCEYECSHTRCAKRCGEPCIECKETCTRKCRHQKCTKHCGAICNIPPCNFPCMKKLKCGHQCVGFCGDPCPVLCRICDNEELSEIFLGREDEVNAIYVMLVECKHVFESVDMEQWLNLDEGEIKAKVCPKCKTTITKTQRYSECIKRCVVDIASVKRKSYGSPDENSKRRNELVKSLEATELKAGKLLNYSQDLKMAIKKLQERLQESRMKNNQLRRQDINRMDLDAIKAKHEVINFIIDVFEKQGYDKLSGTDKSIAHTSYILKILMHDEDRITDQEIDDMTNEIERLSRFIQFERIKQSYTLKKITMEDNVQKKADEILKLLENPKRYDEADDAILQTKLTEISKMVASSVKILELERREIVSALGLSKGHWFKCPNGHPYVITECGGAMQISTCNECGVRIGGQQHRLLPDQRHAPEMDDSQYPAWSEAANMANYRF